LYPFEKGFYLVPRILLVSLAAAVTYLSYKNFGEKIKGESGGVGTLLWSFWAVYWLGMDVIKWSLPYFKFEITNENQLVTYVRALICIAITAVIGGAVYELIRSLF
jgi:uncharacterized membrane protein